MMLTRQRFKEILKEQDISKDMLESLWEVRPLGLDEEQLQRWAEPMGYLMAGIEKDRDVTLAGLLKLVQRNLP